jgi:hypothetical protein
MKAILAVALATLFLCACVQAVIDRPDAAAPKDPETSKALFYPLAVLFAFIVVLYILFLRAKRKRSSSTERDTLREVLRALRTLKNQ